MRQIFQNLKTGEIDLPELPMPLAAPGHLVIQNARSLVSIGTEKMLVEFAQGGWIAKARQQPEKVRQVLDKMRTDGVAATVSAVFSKLNQPMPLGYSSAGVVLEVGSGVEGFAVGDRVVSNGSHAEVVHVPVNLCARIPDGVSDDSAAFTVVTAIGLQGVRLASPLLGETFVVLGLGLIGLLTVQVLRANGCEVIGIDLDPAKVDLARRFGATGFVAGPDSDPVGFVSAHTHGVGADGVLITASTPSNAPIEQAPRMCRKRGRVVLVGVVGLQLARADFYEKEISFQVSCSYGPGRYDPGYEVHGLDYPIGFVRWTEQRNFQAVLQLMAHGRLDVAPLISGRYPLSEAPKLYQDVGHGQASLGLLIEYAQKINTVRTVSIAAAHSHEAQSCRMAILGAGNYTRATLLPALREAPCELHTLVSQNGASSTHLAKQFGFRSASTDTHAVLASADTNTVVITTRHDSHAQLTLGALHAGKHVYVEKPLALTLQELESIRECYAQSNRILMVGFNRRQAPAIQAMRSWLDKTSGAKAMVMTVNAGALPAKHWALDPAVGGGRIVGEGCHFVDLLRYLSGAPIRQWTILGTSDATRDTATISLSFENGDMGTIHYFANGASSFPKERLEVFVGGGIAVMDNYRSIKGYGAKGLRDQNFRTLDKGHRATLHSFIEAINKGQTSPISFQEIYEVSRVAIELEASLRST